jgi:hypothetical protein
MPNGEARGAESRGFRSPDLFLALVLVATVAGCPVEQFVAPDARGAGQPDSVGQDRAEQLDRGFAIHGAQCPPSAANGPASGHRGYRRGR